MFALLRKRDFGLLWLAGLISFTGVEALMIALPLHVYRLTDSTLATAGVLAAFFLPNVVLGSLAGVFVDRWDRKRTMIIVDLARAATLLPIVFAPDTLVVLYAMSAIQGTLSLFFTPAEGALLPKLVGSEHLVAANALNSLNNNLGMLIGSAMGAFLYATIGIGGAALVNVGSYVLSALMISRMLADARPERDLTPASGGAAWARMLADWRSGLGIVAHNQSLRILFASRSMASAAEGVFLTLGLSPLVLDVLGGTPTQVGWMATSQAVGGLIAGVIVVRFGHRMTKRWLFGGGLIGLGLADLGSANALRFASPGTGAVVVAMGFMVLGGPPSVAGGAGRQSIIQEQTVDAYRGRVFGAMGSMQGISMMVGFAVGGVLGDAIGLVPILSAAALLRVVGGLVALVFLPRDDTSPQASAAVTEHSAPLTSD